MQNKNIKDLGTILCVWAHPDDETFCMGGILAEAVRNGQKVICITATCGELGVQDEQRWPAEYLGETRKAELGAALNILGVTEHHYLDYADGSCKDVDTDAAVTRIVDFIEQYTPDTMMTFGPDGLTGHPDHATVSQWTTEARRRAGSKAALLYAVQTDDQYAGSQAVDSALNFFFNTSKPPTVDDDQAAVCLHLSDELFAMKMQALKAMPSQYQIMFEKFEEPALRACFGIEAFVEAANAGAN